MGGRRPPRFTLIGAGAVGSSVGLSLLKQDWRPIGVFGRTPTSARAAALAAEIGADSELELDAACQASDLILIAIPDGHISGVAQELSETEVDWKDKTVIHTSGVQLAEALSSLKRLGASTAAAHPLQSFPGPARPDALKGCYVTVEGDESACRMARGFFEKAESRVVQVSTSDKVAIHLAASVTSNFAVTIASIAREILQTTSLGEQEIVSMLQPLLEGTVQNIRDRGPDRALTGPVVRGDTETVGLHVELLGERAPHLITSYVALVTETVRIARKTARLSSADAMDILDRVIEALPVPPASDEV
ncbi:MAG: putative short-subunit dehydrogenase-like oxidoreductase (DUF2520 family) [Rhodothermales bacterium]|jgi:predicted short-subunit dehydrogenase-like oxidoreductase (DUF2520 family)